MISAVEAMTASEAEFLECMEQKDQSLGQKVEIFYLTYRNAEENLNEFMISVHELENTLPTQVQESQRMFSLKSLSIVRRRQHRSSELHL